MTKNTIVFTGLLLWAFCATARAQWKYPQTKTVDVSDTYFGKTYADPYRWLENLKADDVQAWFKAQAVLADDVLTKIPGRDALVKEWEGLDKLNPASYSGMIIENGRVFYKKTLGGENIGKLYCREGANGSEKLLFDPDQYGKGTKTTIESFLPSWDGNHVVLGLSSGGAEISELRVLDVKNLSLLADRIYPSYGPASWNPDNQSFLYDSGKIQDYKDPAFLLHRKSRIHKLGDSIDRDADFFSDEKYPELGIEPKQMPYAAVSEDYPDYYFGALTTVQSEQLIYYAPASDLPTGKMHWKPLFKQSDNIVSALPHDQYVYAITHSNAPRFKLVRSVLTSPDWAHAQTVLPEASDSLESISTFPHYLIAVYSNGIVGRLVKYEFATGKISQVQLPASGMVDVSCPDVKSDLAYVVITSWTQPATRYEYDPQKETFAKSVFNSDVVYPGFENLTTREVEVPSYDGTMVPLSIIYRKDTVMDGSNCCILDGYGAYGYSYTPYFSILNSVALHHVVLAIAHPRGGGEKGDAWHKAGFKATKPNTWKDYIACAEYLVKEGYTTPEKLGGTGTSAGGILISRAITDRPDLFRAAICNVGCANAMRSEFEPTGPANIPEFGTVTKPDECAALYEMDGVQHVQKGTKYPAVLGVTGWNDPRVACWEPGKFIAALQNAAPPGRPMLLKVNYDDGHFTEEKQVTFNNFASQMSFLLWQTGHKDFQPAQ